MGHRVESVLKDGKRTLSRILSARDVLQHLRTTLVMGEPSDKRYLTCKEKLEISLKNTYWNRLHFVSFCLALAFFVQRMADLVSESISLVLLNEHFTCTQWLWFDLLWEANSVILCNSQKNYKILCVIFFNRNLRLFFPQIYLSFIYLGVFLLK